MKTKYLKIGIILIFCVIAIFFLVKFLLPKKPSQSLPPSPEKILSPEEVVIKYFSLEQEGKRKEAEKYLFSDFTKVEILDERYYSLRSVLWTQLEKEGSLPKYQIVNKEVKENKAKIIVEAETNKMEGSIFFNFILPKKIIFDIGLVKTEGNWKIIKIDSPDLILKSKLSEKIEIRENVFIKPIKIGDYYPKDKKPAEEGNKFLFLEVEFENRLLKQISFFPLVEWRIVSAEEEFYSPIPNLTFEPGKPVILDIKLDPNSISREYIYFEVVKEFSAKKIIFKNLDKKVIFKID